MQRISFYITLKYTFFQLLFTGKSTDFRSKVIRAIKSSFSYSPCKLLKNNYLVTFYTFPLQAKLTEFSQHYSYDNATKLHFFLNTTLAKTKYLNKWVITMHHVPIGICRRYVHPNEFTTIVNQLSNIKLCQFFPPDKNNLCKQMFHFQGKNILLRNRQSNF